MSVVEPPRISDDGLRAFAGYTMKRAFNAIRADLTATLRPFGLRMVTFSALSVIVENPGIRQSQLADLLSIERPNAVGLVDELVRQGLILRSRPAEDQRAWGLSATPRGRDLYAGAAAAVRAHDRRITAGLSEAERMRLIRMLEAIERAGEGPGNDGTKTA